MATFGELHVSEAVESLLSSWGWEPDADGVGDAVATSARGNNLLVLAPPSPAYAVPSVAGLLSGVSGHVLCLAPPAELAALGATLLPLANAADVTAHIARGEARAATALRVAGPLLLIASPDVARALVGRSALKLDQLGGIVLYRPEQMQEADLANLMGDVPAEATRLVVTADRAAAAMYGERYARRAVTVGEASLPALASDVPLRVASCAWDRRAEAVAEVLELLDPPRAAVWAADLSVAADLRRAIHPGVGDVSVVTGDAPRSPAIICYDIPGAPQLAQLQASGDVVVLTPPGTEGFVERLARVRRPLRLSGWLDDIRNEAGQRRAEILRRVEQGELAEAAHVIAPLLSRYDAGELAAALYALWQSGRDTPVPAPVAAPAAAATARLWMGVGTRDNATIADIVATLVKEVGLDRARIGKVDLRESFALVEVPALEVERVAERANGLTIRRRRVVARPDRGPERPSRGARPERSRRG